MDLEGIMLSEISQTEKDKYCMISHISGIQKTKEMNTYNKTETELQIQRTNRWLTEHQGFGGKKEIGEGD